MRLMRLTAAFLAAIAVTAGAATAQETPHTEPEAPGLSPDRMITIIQILDEDATVEGSTVRFRVAKIPLMLVHDETSQRMRIMTPVAEQGSLDPEKMIRLMQANFDSALDARYAIAQSLVWSVFIHPLGGLTEAEFVSGISQTATLAATYGTTFSSGGVLFGGGDSQGLLEDQLKETLEENGLPI